MSNKTGFYEPCPKCGAMLRSKQRLENHLNREKPRCNYLKWASKRRTKGHAA